MAVQARPDTTEPNPTSEQLLVESQRRAENVDKPLARFLSRVERPAQLRNAIRLTATKPIESDDAGDPCASFGVLNPNAVAIYLGIGGTTPRPGQGALSVPPNSMMVLPFSVDVLAVGVDPEDPELGDDVAVVHVWRYETVQPAFLGSA